MSQSGELSHSPGNCFRRQSEYSFQKIHKASVLSLNETLELLNEDAINRAVDLLVQADRVFCFGNGGSMVMAMEAWARFSTATSRFVHVSDSHMQIMNTALATSRDVLLVFSYSGSTPRIWRIPCRSPREHGVSVLLVTHYPNSRAAQFADVVLLCGYNEGPLQSGSIPAKVGQLLLIDCLFYGFCRRNPEASAAARSATAEAVARKML